MAIGLNQADLSTPYHHTVTKMAIIDDWTFRLTGLPVDRIQVSRERIDALGIDHLSNELTRRADIDAVAGACMLDSALDALIGRGVSENKLVAKLRRDRDVWPTAVEMIAGRSALRFFESDLELELDSGSTVGGPNADFRLRAPRSNAGVSIEFKAIGLSEPEVAFFKRTVPLLQKLSPESGVSTNHIDFDSPHLPGAASRAERRSFAREDRKRQRKLPAHIRDLHGAVIAAHYTEQRYLERVRERIETALRQLNTHDDCWVALWWSNGAPVLSVRQVLSAVDLPNNVLGVMLIGAAVAVPDPEIHYYDILLPREELVAKETDPSVVSLEDSPLAEPIFEAFERSTGVRPTLLLNPFGIRGSHERLLFRDGSRPIFPFNLLIGSDPPEMRAFVTRSEGLGGRKAGL